MDNITLLQQLAVAESSRRIVASGSGFDPAVDAFLFQPADAMRLRYPSSGPGSDAPEYPPNGVYIDYYLSSPPAGEMKLEILDSKGGVIRRFRGVAAAAGQEDRKL
ncbi:MAG: hypothetical protein IPM55_09290 [Acidobacteria bacterium]|nr:hypothetical protein [Acidobacteriota bacterium]